MTIDAQRRRAYAAHGGGKALLVVDSDSGKVIGQIKVGPMAGVAVNPANGHVFTGNGDDMSVSEVDPASMTILKSIDVPGKIDAIAYDGQKGRIYADEDDGTHLFVIDAASMKLLKTITLPGHKPEYLQIDPQTHEVYQNIANLSEIAVIDSMTLAVKRVIPTPELVSNHPLQYDAEFRQLVVAGTNGVMSAYSRDGRKIGSLKVPRFDQCDLDPAQHIISCAGDGGLTRLQLAKNAVPTIIDTTPVHPGVHTTAIDPQTHAVFTVWANADGTGDFVQRFQP